ncbi:Hypothetical predicted protein [Mytilus galloprovincialis]|uniref:DDE Tnp4 domain-containing protein n=1 Tax=Mytilus galloprovincialis TaxID=29158 RepID=A0A8B6BSN3_MYTGA|nr:Hypothetical predicted protein [Mytilus galloprovincialis]
MENQLKIVQNETNSLIHVYLMHMTGIWLLYNRLRSRRKRTKYTRSILAQRRRQGDYANLVQEMRLDPEYHILYFRMSREHFEKLARKVCPLLERPRTHLYPISATERLAMTLRYLASGDSQTSIALAFRVSKSTVCNAISEVCDAIWRSLNTEYLKAPTTEQEWLTIEEGFSVCDADYNFTMIDVGCTGRFSDGGIFSNSKIGQRSENEELNIPAPCCLPGTDNTCPYVFVGDEAFPLKQYMMRPYPRTQLDYTKRIFNYRLSRARRVIENAFGILASRWRIFRRLILATPEKSKEIVKAALSLHNFVKYEERNVPVLQRRYFPPRYVDTDDNGNIIEGMWRNEIGDEGGIVGINQTGSNMFKKKRARETSSRIIS